MKKVFLFAALVAASFTGIAQDGESGVRGFKIGGGINVAVPFGDLADFSTIGAGIDVLGQYGFSDNLAVTLDAGYTSFFGKDDFDNTGIIPIRAGLRYFPSSNLYIGAKGGIGIVTAAGGDSESGAAYSVGAGYMMSPKLDIGLTYDGYSINSVSLSSINIRLGYFFGGK